MNAGNAYAFAGNSPWNFEDPIGLTTLMDMLDPDSDIPSSYGGFIAVAASSSELGAELANVAMMVYCMATSLDGLQMGLDALGFIEPFGAIADGINGGIYLVRGQWGNAAISIAAIFAADALVKPLRYADEVLGVVRGADGGLGAGARGADNLSGAGSRAGGDALAAGISRTDGSAVGGLCFVAGTEILREIEYAPIESLEVGQRVITTDNADEEHATSVDPESWVSVALRMADPQAPNFTIEMTVLRPETWLDSLNATQGASIYLEMPEMRLSGPAEVIEISPCPEIETGPGKVILATIKSTSNTVHELHLADLNEPIECTQAHPFYSIEQDDWVSLRDLRVGEHLRTLGGPKVIEGIIPKPGFHSVFNLEVETDHCYVVSNGQVLSHNTNPCAAPLPHGNSASSTRPQHVYEIVDTHTGQPEKYGISGSPLNQNGSSGRANTQVNAMNRGTSPGRYIANVLTTNIPGRANALELEKQVVEYVRNVLGFELRGNKLPKV